MLWRKIKGLLRRKNQKGKFISSVWGMMVVALASTGLLMSDDLLAGSFQSLQAKNFSFRPELLDFGTDGLKGLAEQQKRAVFSDEVVIVSLPEIIGRDKTLISAALKFNRPVNVVWSVLSATERQNDYLREIEKISLLENGPDFNRLEFVVKVLGRKVRYTVIHHFQPENHLLWWELDPEAKNDLKELFGFWRLYPAGENQTIGRYGSYLRPGFPLPEFISGLIYRENIKSTIEKVKNYVESSGIKK